MQQAIERWLSPVRGALQALAGRPALLLLAMLGLNALAYPYAGFTHDAVLYSAQVCNRADNGFLADDLFFRYGSQDEYSVFSPLLTPAVRLLGVWWAFFLAYLACKALLFWGFLRLTSAVVKDRAVAAFALLLLAITPMYYSGFHIFSLNESFLTARLPACGLALCGLAALLDGRPLLGLGLLSGAMFVHPLMALPGLAMGVLWSALEYLPRRLFYALFAAGALLVVFVLACPPVGYRLFGGMDSDWLEPVRGFNISIFPQCWPVSDWWHTAVALLVVTGAALFPAGASPRESRLLTAAVLTGVGGLVVCMAAGAAGYALLVQAQTFRAMWLLQFLCIPLGVQAVWRLWRTGEAVERVGAAVLVQAVVRPIQFFPLELLFYAGSFLMALVACRGLARAPRRQDWVRACLLVALVAGYVLWAAVKVGVVWAYRDVFLTYREALELWRASLIALGPLAWLAAALAAVTWLARLRPAAQLALAAGVWLSASTAAFLIPVSAAYRAHWQGYRRDLEFVEHFLQGRRERGAATPTVYFPITYLSPIWIELHANCYFNLSQLSGAVFSAGTTREGVRRVELTKRFEAARLREQRVLDPSGCSFTADRLYHVSLDEQPTRADLERLCRDPAVHYVIVPYAFDGLYAATNGHVYVYDCAQVRAAPGPAPAHADRHARADARAASAPPRFQAP